MTTATDIITNPTAHAANPELFATAWRAAKAARGETVDLSKTGSPAYQIANETALTRRIRDYAALKGYRLAATS